MRFVPISCVKSGSYLAKDICDNNGNILFERGTKLESNLINSLEENGIYIISIIDDYSNNDIENIIKPQLRIRTINATEQVFKNINPSNSRSKIRANNHGFVRNKISIENVFDTAKDLVDVITSTEDLMINLVDLKHLDNYLYEHSVNTAILSIAVGIELNLSKDELYDLSVGALLHDIGKAFLPKKLLTKKNLTPSEEKLLESHAQKGYSYLLNMPGIRREAKIICLQHHERIDGSGYPMAICGDKISKLSKIVAVANTYDDLTSDNFNKAALPPNDVIEYIMSLAGKYFDHGIVRAFIKKVNPYPPGTLVRLSNGEIGIVDENNENYPLRPKIRIIKQLATTVKMKTIDLLEENNLIIEGIQYEIPNPSVQHYLKQ